MTNKGIREMEECLKEAQSIKTTIGRAQHMLRSLKGGDAIVLSAGKDISYDIGPWGRSRIIEMFEQCVKECRRDLRKLQPKITSKIG